ncbi:hypothetical protein QBC40DRAFT_293914 [Triangularia verruculosa]|uniref:Uncharacterized protein n=1 Tax=Triangularia verruculosa TaxID=2587418 RepID=A0AAN6XT19_9PEZI|nr:hypothetical protein QBC40DRAFT_293914 [Triangularia verruculosa]
MQVSLSGHFLESRQVWEAPWWSTDRDLIKQSTAYRSSPKKKKDECRPHCSRHRSSAAGPSSFFYCPQQKRILRHPYNAHFPHSSPAWAAGLPAEQHYCWVRYAVSLVARVQRREKGVFQVLWMDGVWLSVEVKCKVKCRRQSPEIISGSDGAEGMARPGQGMDMEKETVTVSSSSDGVKIVSLYLLRGKRSRTRTSTWHQQQQAGNPIYGNTATTQLVLSIPNQAGFVVI